MNERHFKLGQKLSREGHDDDWTVTEDTLRSLDWLSSSQPSRRAFAPSDAWQLPDGSLISVDSIHSTPEGAVRQPNAWDHEHCMHCQMTINGIDDPPEFAPEGWTDGVGWMCDKCYTLLTTITKKPADPKTGGS